MSAWPWQATSNFQSHTIRTDILQSIFVHGKMAVKYIFDKHFLLFLLCKKLGFDGSPEIISVHILQQKKIIIKQQKP